MSIPVKKISDSGKWPIAWSTGLPLTEPELEPLREAGFFVVAMALVNGPTPFSQSGVPPSPINEFHDSTTWWIPLEGAAEVESKDGKRFTVSPGSLCLRPLYLQHRTRVLDSFLHIYLRTRDVSLSEVRNIDFPDYRFVTELFEHLRNEIILKRPGYSNVARNLAATMASILQRTSQFEPNRVDVIFHYLMKSPDVLWTTSMLAHKLNMSESLLYKRCRERYRQSPRQIIGEVKMRQADELLAKPAVGLEQIARQLGYSSAYAFSKAYFNFTGRRPGTSRKDLFWKKL